MPRIQVYLRSACDLFGGGIFGRYHFAIGVDPAVPFVICRNFPVGRPASPVWALVHGVATTAGSNNLDWMTRSVAACMKLELRTQYWDDSSARAAFEKFILEIHGLDFSDWKSGGFWDDAFTPFSYFDGDTVVASVCIYLLDAVIHGSETRLAQISSVGTLPEWRRKGLNRQLTTEGLEWARGKHDGVFLFSNPDAVPFYKKCGFSAIDEFVMTTEIIPVENCGGAIKLDPGRRQDRDRIYDFAKRRAPVSSQFSVLNAKLLMFHALYSLCDCVYEIPDLNCLVFLNRERGALNIYDIVGERIPRLEELYPHITAGDDRVIVFHFDVDKLGLNKAEARQLAGNNPFVRAPFPIEKPVFPFTSRA